MNKEQHIELVFKRTNSDNEETEYYQDIDDARADFIYMSQEEPDEFQYAILRLNTVDYDKHTEEIQVLENYTNIKYR